MHGVFENAIYGSRVDNKFDLRIVKEYLNLVFRNESLIPNNNNTIDNNKLEIPPFTLPRSN